MKKRTVAAIGVLGLSLVFGGCGSDSAESSSASSAITEGSASEVVSETSAAEETDDETSDVDVINTSMEEILDGIDVDACVTLGDYTGFELTKEIEEVTDEDVESAIADELAATLIEVEDVAAEGDTVNIDYVGYLDGETFDGGTATGQDLVLGSDSYIDGFEDGLIGSKAGDEVTLNLTFPDGYSDELGGKDVVFEVTVNAVQRAAEELTEDWVTENTEFSSIEEYTADMRTQLEETNESTAEYNLQSAAWEAVVSQATVHEYPESLVTFGAAMYVYQIETYCSYFGVSVDEYLEAIDATEEEYEEEQQAYGENIAAQILIMAAIEDAEGLSSSDADYQDRLDAYVEQSGMDEETFISSYGAFNVEQSIMMERITDIIIAGSEVTEVTVESEDETESSLISETSETEETAEE